ncbi:unnamed protein product [Rhizoctonia solani]|uniref:GmrSD restriction endonucleases C-terminal domain-containing protein n=1 Tax=Rhizoctonia solani TaxID=456999 RepID=A0A8H3AI65_9AGAM|nr:unnamed protein product [Rhizoctonia solani]CAE6517235.1 unnamed protein product [Rhizoctonia solani]
MRFACLLALAALVSASPLNFDTGRRGLPSPVSMAPAKATSVSSDLRRRGQLPTPVSIETAKEYLSELKVAPPVTEPVYDRKKFQQWITIDGKCDTRGTVLKREATTQVTIDPECKTMKGTWISDYDGKLIEDARGLDIDHTVPLKEAWQSGAWSWTPARRKEFANDLTRPQLLAVSAISNRMKGDKDPSKWMPSNPAFRCTYIRAWIEVKHYYDLTVDEAEKKRLTKLIDNC